MAHTTTLVAAPMSAQSFHDTNLVFDKLQSAISAARYTGGRSGMVPPADIGALTQNVKDALATLEMLAAE